MLILAIDSAGNGCSACVWQDGKVLAFREERMERGQDARLLPLIQETLSAANTDFTKLDRIAVARGPGSFTGLRIGLAAARGIGLASNKPVIGIDRFSVFREQVKETQKNLLVAIDAKRAELFCTFYPVNGNAQPPTMMTLDEINAFLGNTPDTIITGDADLATHPNYQKISEQEAVTLASLAAKADAADPHNQPRPLYIRTPDVTIKKMVPQLRKASHADAAHLSRLHNESFENSGWTAEQIEGSLLLPTTHGYIASIDGDDIGFILCQITPDESEILTFCLQPTYRRRGIGTALLNQQIMMVKKAGGNTLLLEVAADNLAACNLYEKAGFTVFGKRPAYYPRGNGWVDALLYRLDVNTP